MFEALTELERATLVSRLHSGAAHLADEASDLLSGGTAARITYTLPSDGVYGYISAAEEVGQLAQDVHSGPRAPRSISGQMAEYMSGPDRRAEVLRGLA